MKATLIAGVDIGGTKTQIMVRQDGHTIADRTVPTETWRSWDVTTDAGGVAALILETCGGQPNSIAVGAHGCDTDNQCVEFELALGRHLRGAVQVVNDSELLVPAAGFHSGIGVVSGTGSIAVARSADGHMLAAGGWGWILGDEGSAPALVREAGRAIRRSLDSGVAQEPLYDALIGELGIDDATKIGRTLNGVRSAAVWGQYAAAVFAAADAGSILARTVIEDGGRELAKLVDVLAKRGANAAHVVAGGGVISRQPRLLDAFEVALAEISPASVVALLRDPPVLGAVALAERLVTPTSRESGATI